MKKISIALIFLIMFLSLFPAFVEKKAHADGETEIVLRVEKDNVYFYSSYGFLEEHKLFLLTKTYFLFGVDYGDYYAVRYKKDTNAEMSGFVKKSDVEIYDDGIPAVIYPEFQITAIRPFSLFYDIVALKSVNGRAEYLGTCYGKIVNGNETYLFIYYEGLPTPRGVYYVNSADFEIIEPKAHPIPLKIIPDNPDGDPVDDDNNDSPTSNETIQIIIIVAVIIFAVAVVYFMFRPNNYKYKRNKEDDDIYNKS